MRWRLFILPLAFALLLFARVNAASSNVGAGKAGRQRKEVNEASPSPLQEINDIFERRGEVNDLKDALAEKRLEKEIIEKSYENYAREADIERKRVEEIDEEIEGLKAALKTIDDKEKIKEHKDEIKKLKNELGRSNTRRTDAVNKAELENKKAGDLGRRIKLLEEKIEEARLRVDKEMKDLYPLAGKTATFVFLLLAVFILRIALLKLVNRYVLRDNQKYFYNKIIKIGFWVIVILFLMFILMGRLESFMLLISFVGAGVAIALKDVITSFVAWFFIIGPNGFRVGDRIEMGDVKGDVIDIALFRTTLMEIGAWVGGEQSAGRIATFPNHLIFSSTLYNYTTGNEFIWNEISFLVTFESNWKKAEEIMLDIAREGSDRVIYKAARKMKGMSRKYMVRFGVLTPAVYIRIMDSGVELTVRYLTDARMRRVSQNRISRDILDAINGAGDIDFAYPTIRYYTRGEESK